MSDQEDEQMLTTAETLALLRVSKPTLYRMMDEGVIAPIPDDNPLRLHRPRLYFRRTDVERVIREGRKPPRTAD